MNPIISIITGTRNRIDYLREMLTSARKSLPPNWVPGVEWEVVVADGGSTDGTLEWLRGQPGVTLIEQGELLGAIKAFNAAGSAAKGDYILVANDDIEFIGLSIARGLAFMMDNPDVGGGCFFQDRNGKDLHVESMPAYRGTEQKWVPYLQVGIVPRWLWDACGGWGDWGGRTYGGDNYLSGRIYSFGYKLVPIEGCAISDKTADDDLRKTNNTNCKDGEILWSKFSFEIADFPQLPNPLPKRRRVLYAPIIEANHEQAKKQKRGLRDALGAIGPVWEVDYVFSGESVVEAAEAWRPHVVVTQFHTAANTSISDVRRVRAACQGQMINFSGDVWSDQSSPEMMEILRDFDYHTTVNAALLPQYEARGIRAVYWQNSHEPGVTDNEEIGARNDIVFLGNEYSEYRTKLGRELKAMPYNVGIYGSWRTEGISSGGSLYDFRKTGQIYRGAKLAIADNQFPEATGFASDRMFMALAAGNCMLLHQRVEKLDELLGLKDGVHYVSWTDHLDLRLKVAYYMEHEDERAKIAAAGTLEARTNQTYAKRVEQLEALISDLPTKKDRISAMMIVRNEAASIRTCIFQLAHFADEIVIVDTGSTDDTLEQIMGSGTFTPSVHPEGASIYEDGFIGFDGKVKLYQTTWADDFSAARNFAKSKCTGEWIFWADADDHIPYETTKLLQRFPWDLSAKGIQNPKAFKLMCVAHQSDEPSGYALQTRIFRNIPNIEWRDPIHETVDASLQELGITPIAFQKVEIHHYTDIDRLEEKQRRNLSILHKMPDSPWKFLQMGNSYAAMWRWGDAIVFFDMAGSAAGEDASMDEFLFYAKGYAYFQMGLRKKAMEALEASSFPDAYYMLSRMKTGSEKIALLQKFMEAETPTNLPTKAPFWREKAKEDLRTFYTEALEKLK